MSEVAVAAVTVPTAPLLKTTVLLPAVVSKPKPSMVSVVALAARLAVLLVTTGVTVATWTAAPLLTLLVVTTAVRLPAAVGAVENVTVSAVAVAAVTVPTAPSLKATVLLPAVVSKPEPCDGERGRVGGQVGGAARHDRRDRGHLDCRAAVHAVGGDHGRQVAGGGGRRGERHGERRRGRRGDGPDRPVVEDDRVVGGRGVEAKAVDGERGRVGGQAGRAARHDRRDRRDLDCLAAGQRIGRDHGGQVAGGGRLGGERHGELRRGRRGDGPDRPVVEDDRVVGRPSYRSQSRRW